MSKPMTYYEWLDFWGLEDTDGSYDAYLDAKRNMDFNNSSEHNLGGNLK